MSEKTVEECIKRITVETGEMLARAEGYDDLMHSWWSAPNGWTDALVEKWAPLIREAVDAESAPPDSENSGGATVRP